MVRPRAPLRRAAYRRHGTHRHRVRSPFGGRAVIYWRSLGPGLVTGASDNDTTFGFLAAAVMAAAAVALVVVWVMG